MRHKEDIVADDTRVVRRRGRHAELDLGLAEHGGGAIVGPYYLYCELRTRAKVPWPPCRRRYGRGRPPCRAGLSLSLRGPSAKHKMRPYIIKKYKFHHVTNIKINAK